jgi:hypothetical protein
MSNLKNVLAMGGYGFMGSIFVHFPLRSDIHIQVINLDALTESGGRENLKYVPDKAAHIFVKSNICDLEPDWTPEHDLREGMLKTVLGYPGYGDRFETNHKQKHYRVWIPKNYTERVEGGK